jgi:hypothetical protein
MGCAMLVMTGLDESFPVPPQFKSFSSAPMVPVVPFIPANINSIPTLVRPIGQGLAVYCNIACCLAVIGLLALCAMVMKSKLKEEKKLELVNFVFLWAVGGFSVIWNFKNLVDEQQPQEGWNALFVLVAVLHVAYECVIAPSIVFRCFPSGRTMLIGIIVVALATVMIVQTGLISFTRATNTLTIVTFVAHSCGKLAITTLNMGSPRNQLALLMWWGHAAPELLACFFECSLFLEVTIHFFVVAPLLFIYVGISIGAPKALCCPGSNLEGKSYQQQGQVHAGSMPRLPTLLGSMLKPRVNHKQYKKEDGANMHKGKGFC